MKICFIPGFACRAEIFDSILNIFENSFCVDWHPESIREIKTMNQLCEWTLKTYESRLLEADVFVGHSLGGGVAFELSYLPEFRGKRVVLVDYFLAVPPHFFRNHCSEETPKVTHDQIKAMLDANRPFFDRNILETVAPYSPERLKERQTANGIKLSAIYGMRSENNVEKVERALELPASVRQYIELDFVPLTAHFPMIEQPKKFSDTLVRLLHTTRAKNESA